jgi:hypothetical protein
MGVSTPTLDHGAVQPVEHELPIPVGGEGGA